MKIEDYLKENFEIELIYLELLNSDKEIDVILNNPVKFPYEIIENLSIKIAVNYWNEIIDYSTSNEMISHVYGYWITNENFFNNYIFPEISMNIYDAFDAGEYYHREDDKNVDPMEKYTKSEIETILRKLKIII